MNATPNISLVLASRNVKKSREIADLLARDGIDVVSIADFPDVAEVIEDGDTFGENARKKAVEPATQLSRWVLAEDSGLIVDALDGSPGVYSARYSGDDATDAKNNEKLIAELIGVPDEQRTARYICHVAVADPTGTIQLEIEACCGGRITAIARGENGFGYDPFFLITEFGKTFGELSPLVKSQISHRARAFQRLRRPLVKLLKRECRSP